MKTSCFFCSTPLYRFLSFVSIYRWLNRGKLDHFFFLILTCGEKDRDQTRQHATQSKEHCTQQPAQKCGVGHGIKAGIQKVEAIQNNALSKGKTEIGKKDYKGDLDGSEHGNGTDGVL